MPKKGEADKTVPGDSPKVDIDALVGELTGGKENGDVKKYLEEKLAEGDTREEALLKLAKQAPFAEKKISEQGKIIGDLKGQLSKTTPSTPVPNPEIPPIPPVQPNEDLRAEIDALKAKMGTGDEYNVEMEKSKLEVAQMRTDNEAIRIQQANMLNQLREQKFAEGYQLLVDKLGEDAAKYKDILKQALFSPDTIQDSLVKEWAKQAQLGHWHLANPVKSAFLYLGSNEDRVKVLSDATLPTETPGKSTLGEASELSQEKKDVIEHFGFKE